MTTILISGASVAGPALAYWLRRFGFTPTVVERAPAPRPGGYAVDFRGASLTVLDRMGLLPAARARATGMGGMVYVNESGRPIAKAAPEAFSGELELLRGDLVEILYAATRADVEYLFDDSIASLEQDEGGVQVVLERGGSRRFDLVIGADGLHSNVRGLAFGPEEKFSHQLGLDHTGRFLTVPGKTVGTYSARDNTEAKAMFYFASPEPALDRQNIAAQQKIVAESYAGLGWEVPRLPAGMQDAPDFYFDSISQIKLDSYSTGRVALVGDAGYCASPLSGMGTSLAIVGAYVLAGELHTAGGDHRRAFTTYDEVMRGFVAASQKQAVDGARWLIPGGRAFLAVRNLTFRLLPYLPWRRLIDEMPLKVGNAVDLKEYEALPPQPAAPHR